MFRGTLFHGVIGSSRLEGALGDLTQFGVLCSVIGMGERVVSLVYHVIKANN